MGAEHERIMVYSSWITSVQGSLQQQVLGCLADGQLLTRAALRDRLSVQNQRLGEALETLERAGKIRRSPDGWQRVD